MSDVVLLLSCRDRPGIVAAVTAWVAAIGGNITDAQQHTDHEDQTFFQRVQFTPPEEAELNDLQSGFVTLATELDISYRFHVLPYRPRTAILVSKHLHCLSDVLGRVHLGDLPLDVKFVVSNHEDGRDLCGRYGHEFRYLPVGSAASGRKSQEQELGRVLDVRALDLVILARYMLVLPPEIIEPWSGKMINIHHSFLPSFVGANPYRQAHDRGVKIIGATAHYVSEVLDEGPIIAQSVVQVSHRDDVAALSRRGRDVETTVLARAIRSHLEHRVLMFGNRTIVFD